jgi:hypothetical protein
MITSKPLNEIQYHASIRTTGAYTDSTTYIQTNPTKTTDINHV